MAQTITTKKFAKNVVYSIIAQIISLSVSFILTLIVPRFIDELQYANWQMYVLYVGYVGVLHFGLLDGLVLRYSKYDYEELDKARLRSQFVVLLIFTSVISFAAIAVSLFAFGGANKIIFVLVAVGIITKNIVTYSSYMFQITNRINKYVILTIAQRLAYGVFVIVLLALKVNDFFWYCLADLFGDAVGIIIGAVFNRGLFFGKLIGIKETFNELKVNVLAGIILMMANWSAMLMIGSAKMLIQWHWDKLVFGKVSFAFSVSNIFLVFVTAISVVLFPSLQRIQPEKLPSMYKSIRNVLSPVLFFMMLFYFIGSWILNLWLPKYSESLVYLGILLPIIIFSSKVSLLTNNYLKVYRKEKLMLLANVISIALGISLFALCAYVFNNLTALLCCVVGVIMFNSVLSEIFVLKTIKVKIIKEFIVEAVMTVGFILCASLLSLWIGMAVYAALFAAYCLFNYKLFVSLFKKFSKNNEDLNALKDYEGRKSMQGVNIKTSKVMTMITTYNPDIQLLQKNIDAILNQSDKVLIFDNCSENCKDIESLCKEKSVELVLYDKNYGVAKPLYDGIEYAVNNNFKYVFTLDQDSITPERAIVRLKEIIESNSNLAMVAIKSVPIDADIDSINVRGEIRYCDEIITSGTLANACKIKKIGNYITDMFIDWVDFEMCYRIKKFGYKIAITDEMLLRHHMGEPVRKRLLWKTCIVLNYSPMRLYYIWRNAYFCFYKYSKNHKFIKEDKKRLRALKLKIILYEDNKIEKLKAIKKGYKEAKKFYISHKELDV